jgi:hypothetical protein
MTLYALGLVKDEADVLEANIRHAATFCDRIFYMDNGSTDGSWEIIESLAAELPGTVVAYERTTEPYVEGMRNRIVNDLARELGPDGWWLKLDADEFLSADPRPAIAAATAAGANGIRAWQVQFAFTDADLRECEAGRDDPTRPIYERRRHYRVDWREYRLWRNQPDVPWTDVTRSYPPGIDRPARRAVFNRHYQYRTPEQIQHRLEIRRGDRHFPHQQQADWRLVVQPAADFHVHEDGQPFAVDWGRFVLNQARVRLGHLRRRLPGGQVPASRTPA